MFWDLGTGWPKRSPLWALLDHHVSPSELTECTQPSCLRPPASADISLSDVSLACGLYLGPWIGGLPKRSFAVKEVQSWNTKYLRI